MKETSRLPRQERRLFTGRIRIVYHLMRFGGEYVKRTEAEYAAEVRSKLEKQLRRRAKELGYEVTKKAEPAAELVPA